MTLNEIFREKRLAYSRGIDWSGSCAPEHTDLVYLSEYYGSMVNCRVPTQTDTVPDVGLPFRRDPLSQWNDTNLAACLLINIKS